MKTILMEARLFGLGVLLLLASPASAGPLVQCASAQKAICERLATQVRAELSSLRVALDMAGLDWRWVIVDEARWLKMSREYQHAGKAIGQITVSAFSSFSADVTYLRQFVYQKDAGRLRRELLHELIHIRSRDEEWTKRETKRILAALETKPSSVTMARD